MKKLSEIIAAGLVAEPEFINSLATLIEYLPQVGELLAEEVKAPSMELATKAAEHYLNDENKTIVEVCKPHLNSDLRWVSKVRYTQTRYYERENGCGSSSLTKTDKCQHVYTYNSDTTIDILQYA